MEHLDKFINAYILIQEHYRVRAFAEMPTT